MQESSNNRQSGTFFIDRTCYLASLGVSNSISRGYWIHDSSPNAEGSVNDGCRHST